MWKDTENRGGGDWGIDIGKNQHQISRIGNRFEVKEEHFRQLAPRLER